MLPGYNKTIVARCDRVHGVLHTLRVKWHPQGSPLGVQQAMDPVTACNNCITSCIHSTVANDSITTIQSL